MRIRLCQVPDGMLTRSLGMSSLEPKDAIPDYKSLNEAQMKTLDQWETFFEKVRSVSVMGKSAENSFSEVQRCGTGEARMKSLRILTMYIQLTRLSFSPGWPPDVPTNENPRHPMRRVDSLTPLPLQCWAI